MKPSKFKVKNEKWNIKPNNLWSIFSHCLRHSVFLYLSFGFPGWFSIFTWFGGTCSQICAHLRIYVHFLALWGIFCFFGISRRCSTTIARHLLDVARHCSMLLDVARCLLDVRCGFFEPTGTDAAKQPKNTQCARAQICEQVLQTQ